MFHPTRTFPRIDGFCGFIIVKCLVGMHRQRSRTKLGWLHGNSHEKCSPDGTTFDNVRASKSELCSSEMMVYLFWGFSSVVNCLAGLVLPSSIAKSARFKALMLFRKTSSYLCVLLYSQKKSFLKSGVRNFNKEGLIEHSFLAEVKFC